MWNLNFWYCCEDVWVSDSFCFCHLLCCLIKRAQDCCQLLWDIQPSEPFFFLRLVPLCFPRPIYPYLDFWLGLFKERIWIRTELFALYVITDLNRLLNGFVLLDEDFSEEFIGLPTKNTWIKLIITKMLLVISIFWSFCTPYVFCNLCFTFLVSLSYLVPEAAPE